MAQTADGWLWLRTPNGLYRFDGVHFYPGSLAQRLPSRGCGQHEAVVEYGARAQVLTMRDDGRGFDIDTGAKRGHWGLHGIEERARRIHADAVLRTAPGAGTTWRIEMKAALAYADGRRRLRWPRLFTSAAVRWKRLPLHPPAD